LVQAEGETTDDVFLKKIFESVKVDLAQDTCLFSFVQSKAFNWKTINSSFEFDQLVFFGRNLQNLGLQIAAQAYVPFNFQEKQILVAEPLNVIATDRAKKGALWNALKGMFLS